VIAKNKLLNIPDEEWNYLQIAIKNFILNPKKEKETMKEIVDCDFRPLENVNKSVFFL
jgi:hypothetical protein